jgi:hypothetical protein
MMITASSTVQASGTALQEFVQTLNNVVIAYQACINDNVEGEYLEKKRQQRLISEEAALLRKKKLDDAAAASSGNDEDTRPSSVGGFSAFVNGAGSGGGGGGPSSNGSGLRLSKTRSMRSIVRTGRPQQLRARRGSTHAHAMPSPTTTNNSGGGATSANHRSSTSQRLRVGSNVGSMGGTPSTSTSITSHGGSSSLFGALTKMRTNMAGGGNEKSSGDGDSSSDDGMWGSDDD